MQSVSVVMTVLGEPGERLERALAAVRSQVFDGELEILVARPPGDVDPAGTRVVDNPTGARSAGLNLAVAAATGDVIVRVDARAVLPSDYIARCVARLAGDPTVGVVGGVQLPVARSGDLGEQGIARALRNPWATGGAAYRRVGASGPTDTAYMGVFRRAELIEVGGWDERLDANEDFDLAQRYIAAGFKVWLEEGVNVTYEPRTTLRAIWQQYFAFGKAKARYWRVTGELPSLRQMLPVTGTFALVLGTFMWPPTLGVAAVGLVVVDHAADPSERSLWVRNAAYVAYIPIIGGWVAGVLTGVFARRD